MLKQAARGALWLLSAAIVVWPRRGLVSWAFAAPRSAAVLARDGLEGWTVNDLRAELRELGLPVSGTKPVIIDRLWSHLEVAAATEEREEDEGEDEEERGAADGSEASKPQRSSSDDLERRTVKDLQAELRRLGLLVSGTKPVLVERLRDHFRAAKATKEGDDEEKEAEEDEEEEPIRTGREVTKPQGLLENIPNVAPGAPYSKELRLLRHVTQLAVETTRFLSATRWSGSAMLCWGKRICG